MFKFLLNNTRHFALATLTLIGCSGDSGPELAEVTGTVTLDGSPVAGVNLQFTPESEDGSPSYGVTDADGQYELLYSIDRSGAMPGKHRVEILPAEPNTDDSGKPVASSVMTLIPTRYTQPGTLTADIQSGSNTVDFALQSK